MLTLLETKRTVLGKAVRTTNDGVVIETNEGIIPIYMFKMNDKLQAILTRDRGEWNV